MTNSLKDRKPVELDGTTIASKTDLLRFLDANCPQFMLIQQLANGVMHACYVDALGKIEGCCAGPFGIGPFGRPHLLIDLFKRSGKERYLVASTVILAAGQCMADLSKRLRRILLRAYLEKCSVTTADAVHGCLLKAAQMNLQSAA